MQVQPVEFIKSEAVNTLFQIINREKVARHVRIHSSPMKNRGIRIDDPVEKADGRFY